MNKYIDADLLRKDIEFAKSVYSNPKRVVHGVADAFRQDGRAAMCDDILKKLDSLPEQPVEWKDEYREEDLRTRFAFYTYKTEEDDSILYLSNVFVEEASRNAGFGTKILEAAERVAETIGAITIRLKVKQDSPANAWYRKHGYGYIAFEGDYDWLEKNLEYLKPKRNEQPVEGLKEECERFYRTDEYKIADNLGRGFETIARHFAEWGASHAVAPHYFKLREIKTGRVFFAEWSDIAGEWYERGNGKAHQSDEVEIVQHLKK